MFLKTHHKSPFVETHKTWNSFKIIIKICMASQVSLDFSFCTACKSEIKLDIIAKSPCQIWADSFEFKPLLKNINYDTVLTKSLGSRSASVKSSGTGTIAVDPGSCEVAPRVELMLADD